MGSSSGFHECVECGAGGGASRRAYLGVVEGDVGLEGGGAERGEEVLEANREPGRDGEVGVAGLEGDEDLRGLG